MTKTIKNRRAKFEYNFLAMFEAGVQLTGAEVKSVRAGEANLNDAYCMFKNGELYILKMYIAEYKMAPAGMETRRERKLLLSKAELRKIEKKAKEKGFAVVPYQLYTNDRGLIKIEIALAQGKKAYDKRKSIKDRDEQRDLDRAKRDRF